MNFCRSISVFARDPSEISGSSGYYSQETQAMVRFGIPRNTLRDYIGICELRRIDTKEWSRQNGKDWERSPLNLLSCALGRF